MQRRVHLNVPYRPALRIENATCYAHTVRNAQNSKIRFAVQGHTLKSPSAFYAADLQVQLAASGNLCAKSSFLVGLDHNIRVERLHIVIPLVDLCVRKRPLLFASTTCPKISLAGASRKQRKSELPAYGSVYALFSCAIGRGSPKPMPVTSSPDEQP